MARPAFAKVRRRQETVHELLVGVRRSVTDEQADFLRLGRQAEEVERETANERRAVGFGRGGELFLRETGADERINRMPRRRHRWPLHRLIRPVVRLLHRELAVVRPDCARIYPRAHFTDLGGSKRLLLGRHDVDLAQTRERVDQLALGALAGDEDLAVVAAFEGRDLDVEAQAALLLFRTVAGMALGSEERLDVACKIHQAAGGGRKLAQVERGLLGFRRRK